MVFLNYLKVFIDDLINKFIKNIAYNIIIYRNNTL